MFRPVFIFKILILSLVTNLICFVYLLLPKSQIVFENDELGLSDEGRNYHGQQGRNTLSSSIKVIPMPHYVTDDDSRLFLSDGFRIVAQQSITPDLRSAIDRYSKYISALAKISTGSGSRAENTLTIDCPSIGSEKNNGYPEMGESESYRLNVTAKGLYLHASSLTGVVRGLATVVQLIDEDPSTKRSFVPHVAVVDGPRFVWRGLMVDVCRHWMPVAVIERTLNAMELSKLNVLHLHLSDDQGFRAQSVEYPLLNDRELYFTQADLRHLVEYARVRRIRVVPEFDVPGHATSWFVGYPELASRQSTYQVETQWGVLKATMDPTKDSTYTFLDRFFGEMTKLFPDPYFHIGGDEVEGSQWRESPAIRSFITEHKLGNKNGLQAYFNKRVQKLLKKYGKTMIGWEEILDEFHENLAVEKDAVIQAWKSRKALGQAVNRGYRGLLSNGYYLDHVLPSTYHYEIDPLASREEWLFNDEQLSRILGGEACMWSEYTSEHTIDSRIWPRVLTIAERLWSSSSVNHSDSLYARLFRMNHLLDRAQIGLTHLSSYKQRLENLIGDASKKKDLLHPFKILADACEATGYPERSSTNVYSSKVPLTTFTDALQSESELVWKLVALPFNNETLREIFRTWSINHVRLQALFASGDKRANRQLWGQNIEQLSQNLAHVGRIGLRVLNFGSTRTFHQQTNHTMNTWTLLHWISYHQQTLNQLESQVQEVRLAAVRPVRQLLNSIDTIM